MGLRLQSGDEAGLPTARPREPGDTGRQSVHLGGGVDGEKSLPVTHPWDLGKALQPGDRIPTPVGAAMGTAKTSGAQGRPPSVPTARRSDVLSDLCFQTSVAGLLQDRLGWVFTSERLVSGVSQRIN